MDTAKDWIAVLLIVLAVLGYLGSSWGGLHILRYSGAGQGEAASAVASRPMSAHCRSLPDAPAPDSPDFSTKPGVFGCDRGIADAIINSSIRDGVAQGRCVKRAEGCSELAG